MANENWREEKMGKNEFFNKRIRGEKQQLQIHFAHNFVYVTWYVQCFIKMFKKKNTQTFNVPTRLTHFPFT